MLLDAQNLTAPIDFTDLFGRSGPVELEIGVGKGRFLKEYALANPEKNLIGIEKSKKWLKIASTRIERAQIQNVRLFSSYAQDFLPEFISDASIATYHVYFPDPWPKRRHHKRRLFGTWFLSEVRRTLLPGGTIHIATDHADYFSAISSELEGAELKGLHFKRAERGLFVTNFQAKYEEEGRPIYFLQGTKSTTSPGKTTRPASSPSIGL